MVLEVDGMLGLGPLPHRVPLVELRGDKASGSRPKYLCIYKYTHFFNKYVDLIFIICIHVHTCKHTHTHVCIYKYIDIQRGPARRFKLTPRSSAAKTNGTSPFLVRVSTNIRGPLHRPQRCRAHSIGTPPNLWKEPDCTQQGLR